jgi:hypothetical protein
MATGLLPPTAGERCIQNSPAARYPGSCLPGSGETRRLCMALRPAAAAFPIREPRARCSWWRRLPVRLHQPACPGWGRRYSRQWLAMQACQQADGDRQEDPEPDRGGL